MSDKPQPLAKILPRHHYSRDPLDILIDKENGLEKRMKGCKGCRFMSVDAIGDRTLLVCVKGRKVGRKGKCSIYKEAE